VRAVETLGAAILRRLFRERGALLGVLLAPAALGLGLALVLPLGAGAFRIELVLAVGDRDEAAMAVLRGPVRDLYQSGLVRVSPVDEAEQVRAAVAGRWSDVGLIIPPGFSERVRGGRAASLRVVVHPDARREGEILRHALSAFARGVGSVQLAVRTARAAADDRLPESDEELADAAAALPPPIVVVAGGVGVRQAPSGTSHPAAMGALFALVAGWMGVRHLPSERRSGVLARVLAAPIRPASVPLAALAAGVTLAFLSMCIAWLSSTLLLGTTWGDPVAVAVLLAAAATASGGGALLTATLVADERTGTVAMAGLALVGALAGGLFFPLALAPEPLLAAAAVSPHGWFLAEIHQLATGADLRGAAGTIGALLTAGLLAGGLAIVIFLRRGAQGWHAAHP
jgi:ABC-2 type transport system permease protein